MDSFLRYMKIYIIWIKVFCSGESKRAIESSFLGCWTLLLLSTAYPSPCSFDIPSNRQSLFEWPPISHHQTPQSQPTPANCRPKPMSWLFKNHRPPWESVSCCLKVFEGAPKATWYLFKSLAFELKWSKTKADVSRLPKWQVSVVKVFVYLKYPKRRPKILRKSTRQTFEIFTRGKVGLQTPPVRFQTFWQQYFLF